MRISEVTFQKNWHFELIKLSVHKRNHLREKRRGILFYATVKLTNINEPTLCVLSMTLPEMKCNFVKPFNYQLSHLFQLVFFLIYLSLAYSYLFCLSSLH
jgi:hypothetical protein